MQFLLLVYNEQTRLDDLPTGEADAMMRHCLTRADHLRAEGTLIESQMLEDAREAKTVRIRDGRVSTVDGPFAETKEVLGGFNLIEADSMEEAVRIAQGFPWAATGSIEVRPVRSIDSVRRRVFAEKAAV